MRIGREFHLLDLTRGQGIDYRAVPEISPMTVREVNTRVVELAELHERDTQDLYALLEDAQDGRSHISQRVDMNSQRVGLLMGDRMTLQETVWMVEEEAYASREAWARSIRLSQATHQSFRPHRDQVYAHRPIYRHTRHSYSCRVLSFRHSTRCCLDLVEWSDKNLRSRGICHDLGSTQEKDDGQVLIAEGENQES
ncbi:hypothetical protein Tco_1483729 [Tanacetum coccineum]